jgi:hypothetical protein
VKRVIFGCQGSKWSYPGPILPKGLKRAIKWPISPLNGRYTPSGAEKGEIRVKRVKSGYFGYLALFDPKWPKRVQNGQKGDIWGLGVQNGQNGQNGRLGQNGLKTVGSGRGPSPGGAYMVISGHPGYGPWQLGPGSGVPAQNPNISREFWVWIDIWTLGAPPDPGSGGHIWDPFLDPPWPDPMPKCTGNSPFGGPKWDPKMAPGGHSGTHSGRPPNPGIYGSLN